jgi:hypothetical protein
VPKVIGRVPRGRLMQKRVQKTKTRGDYEA